MFSRRFLATLLVATFAFSGLGCSSLTRPDDISVQAEQKPAPPAPAGAANAAAAAPQAPRPAAAPGGGG